MTSTISITGVIDNPEPILTHEEPQTPYTAESLAPGITCELHITNYRNTGNVPQTLSVSIGNAQGVTIQSANLVINDLAYGLTATLNPGFSAYLRVVVATPDAVIGADTNYSFDLTNNWS